MKSILLCFLLLAGFAQAQTPTATTTTSCSGLLKAGDKMSIAYQTPASYGMSTQRGIFFEQEFHEKDASYIKLYFEDFDLNPGDYVEIIGHTSNKTLRYDDQGKVVDREGHTRSDFWTQILFDDRVTVRLYASGNPQQHRGFAITEVAYGHSRAHLDALLNATKSICGADNRERPACYASVNGLAANSNAVCLIIFNGTSACTGWVLGSEGHVMTNNHCISSSSVAQGADFIFSNRHSNCTGSQTDLQTTIGGSSVVRTNSSLDYSLIQLASVPNSSIGYLQLSPNYVNVGDRLYILGHPRGGFQQASVKIDQGDATVHQRRFNGITYFADTEPGSSGSPVIDAQTHQVIAIHSAGGCPNLSYGRSDKLIADLGSNMPNNGVGPGPSACANRSNTIRIRVRFESGLGTLFDPRG